MRSAAERELVAPRADVWAFLAEPHHLSDWWPGIAGVRPDRRGFAAGGWLLGGRASTVRKTVERLHALVQTAAG